jgi:acyl carrier protein
MVVGSVEELVAGGCAAVEGRLALAAIRQRRFNAAMPTADESVTVDSFLADVVSRFAPGRSGIDEDEPLQSALGLDSFDFLNLMGDVATEFGIVVSELEYPRISTLGTFRAYLLDRVGPGCSSC